MVESISIKYTIWNFQFCAKAILANFVFSTYQIKRISQRNFSLANFLIFAKIRSSGKARARGTWARSFPRKSVHFGPLSLGEKERPSRPTFASSSHIIIMRHIMRNVARKNGSNLFRKCHARAAISDDQTFLLSCFGLREFSGHIRSFANAKSRSNCGRSAL